MCQHSCAWVPDRYRYRLPRHYREKSFHGTAFRSGVGIQRGRVGIHYGRAPSKDYNSWLQLSHTTGELPQTITAQAYNLATLMGELPQTITTQGYNLATLLASTRELPKSYRATKELHLLIWRTHGLGFAYRQQVPFQSRLGVPVRLLRYRRQWMVPPLCRHHPGRASVHRRQRAKLPWAGCLRQRASVGTADA
jgi:hypothetical protein